MNTWCLTPELRFQRAPWGLHDDARRRAVRVQLAVGVDDAALRCGGPSPDVDDARLAAEQASLLRERPREVDLQLQRGEAPAGRHRRVGRAAERGVEQAGGEPAVRHARAVVEALLV